MGDGVTRLDGWMGDGDVFLKLQYPSGIEMRSCEEELQSCEEELWSCEEELCGLA